jgi:hypothetical protein
MKLLRQIGTRLTLLLTSSLLTLGAIEFLLRYNVIPSEYFLRHRVLGDAGDAPLLLVLGDSFMAPIPGSDVVDYLVPELGPHRVRVRNTATPGTGPVAYFDNLRQEGPIQKPAVILLSYYVGNDLLDVGCSADLSERLRPAPPVPAWKRLYVAQYAKERMQAIRPGSVLFQSVIPGAEIVTVAAKMFSRLAEPEPDLDATGQQVDYEAMKKAGIPASAIDSARAGTLNPWIVSLGVHYPDYYRDELLVRSDCARQAWQNTRQVLDSIMAHAARLDAQVLPVIYPHTFQVNAAHYPLYRAWKINVDEEMRRTHRPQQLLTEYFRAYGVTPLDLLEPFQGAAQKLYWDHDEHMNIQGQQLAAKLIAQTLIARYGDRLEAGASR